VRIASVLLAVLCGGCGHPGAYLRDRATDLADCLTLEGGIGLGLDIEVHATDWLATGVGAAGSVKWGFAGRYPVGFEPDRARVERNGADCHIGFPVAPVLFWLSPLWPPPESIREEAWKGGLRFLVTHFAARDSGWPVVLGGNVDRCADDGGERVSVLPNGRVCIARPDERIFDYTTETCSVFLLNLSAFTQRRGRAYKPKWVETLELNAGASLFPLSARVGLNPAQFLDFVLGWTTLDIGDDDRSRHPPRSEGDTLPPLPPEPPCSCTEPKRKSRVAFARGKQVWVACADCLGRRKLLELPGVASLLSWSPDGRHIATFVGDTLYVIAESGQVVATVDTRRNCDHTVAWSPDGDQLAFNSDDAVQVATLGGRGVSVAQLIATPWSKGRVAWSPNGRWIAFEEASGRRICRVDVATRGLVPLTKEGGPHYFPAWSPDSKRIAFLSWQPREASLSSYALYVMDFDGRSLRRVGRTSATYTRPTWSPDGTRVLYHAADGSVRAVHVDTGDEATAASDALAPSSSSDGKWIAYCSRKGLGMAIWIADPLGRQSRQVTSGDYWDRDPQWCPR